MSRPSTRNVLIVIGIWTFSTSAVNVHSDSDGKINYRFAHGIMFQFAAEGSWNAKAGATNTYNFVVAVHPRNDLMGD